MKKRTTFIITLIAIMTALTTACGAAKESSLPTSSVVEEKPQATTSITTTAQTTTQATAQTTEQTTAETTTTAETVAETTAPKPIETTAETTQQTTAATVPQTEPVQAWTETAHKATMYVTESCNSRKDAVIGATAVKSYSVNTKVSVTAKTNTGYCKLADGTYIHSDYLSMDKVKKITTTTTAKPKPVETTAKVENTTPKVEEDYRWTEADVLYLFSETKKYADSIGFKNYSFPTKITRYDPTDEICGGFGGDSGGFGAYACTGRVWLEGNEEYSFNKNVSYYLDNWKRSIDDLTKQENKFLGGFYITWTTANEFLKYCKATGGSAGDIRTCDTDTAYVFIYNH